MIFIGAPLPPPTGTPLHFEGAVLTSTLIVCVIALVILGVAIERTINYWNQRKIREATYVRQGIRRIEEDLWER